jgi:hypothetical protein
MCARFALSLLVALVLACGSTAPGGPDATDPGTRDAADAADAKGDAADATVDAKADAAADATADSDEVFVPGPDPKSEPLFPRESIAAFQLDFTADQWTLFQAALTKGVKDYAHCRFTFGVDTFVDAACRPKGNPATWPDQKKPQFVVRFNHWDRNGRFLGLRAVNLDFSPYPVAPVRDRLGMEFMAAAGIDASRVGHARLALDGRDLGLYQVIEVVDREFLENHFADPTGNLYEDGSQLITNEQVGDLTRLWDLNDLLAKEPLEGDHGAFFAALEHLVNVRQVVREIAAESALPTGDNFVNGGTNFLWYDDPAGGFRVVPWDLGDLFTAASRTDADLWAYWGEPAGGLAPCRLWQLVQQDAAWKAEFLADVRELRDGPLADLKTRVASVCGLIRSDFGTDPYRNGDLAAFDADCAAIADWVDARIAFLQQAAP